MTGVFIGGIILLAGVALFILPFISGMDMMRGGYALQCLSGLIGLTGILVLVFWGQRAATMNKILSGKGVLAFWEYSQLDGEKYAQRELKERLEYNKTIYVVMLVFAVIFGCLILGIPAISGEIHPAVLLAWFGFFAFLGLLAWGIPRLDYRRAVRRNREVFITEDGVYIYGALHTWRQPLVSLQKVAYEPDDHGPALVFYIRYLSRTSLTLTETRAVRVPVPLGQEDKALEVVKYFKDRN